MYVGGLGACGGGVVARMLRAYHDDCDGFTDADEALIGTDPNDPCPNTTAAIDDAWPADVDTAFGFRIINALDISLILPPVFGSTRAGGPPYLERLDVDRAFGDGVINALDIAMLLPPVFGAVCT